MKIILNKYPEFKKKNFNKNSVIVVDTKQDTSETFSRDGFSYNVKADEKTDGLICYEVNITATVDSEFVGFEFSFPFDGATASDYVFAPAALYNGNRFKKLKKSYPPIMTKEDGYGANLETTISDVPSLNPLGGEEVHINAGDMSTPCIGFFDQNNKEGILLFTEQKNELGNFGYNIVEEGVCVSAKENSGKRTISFTSPCIREKKYDMCSTGGRSFDKPARIKKGEVVTFSVSEYRFDADNIENFYKFFFEHRRAKINNSKYPELLPFKKAYDIIEEKYNSSNWKEYLGAEKYSLYRSSEADHNICGEWQTGWVGGAMNTLPMLGIGNKLSKERSAKTLDFVFDKVQSESGLLYGIFYDGKPYGDGFSEQGNADFVMSRKNADALYYLMKHLIFLGSKGDKISSKWHIGVKKLADAIVRISEKYGHFGQFLDLKKEEILVGATASAGIVMAGLALAGNYFGEKKYLNTAIKLGDFYNENYLQKGLANGGPGEILQCPDSEAAFGLLESYVVLYEITGDNKWKAIAENAARQCSSWCVSYDYSYQAETQFAERNISTTGCVWANVQNKHSSPGICTLSGSSLLRLYRMTGEEKYLQLLHDISHNITQLLGTEDRPMRASYVWHNGDARRQKRAAKRRADRIFKLSSKSTFWKKLLLPLYNGAFNKVGRMNERSNLSDWEGANNVGEVPHGSCWCEVSVMLTALEIPSLYIDGKQGKHFVFDHIKVEQIKENASVIRFKLTNPTAYDSEYSVYYDKRDKNIIDIAAEQFERITLAAGKSKEITIKKLSK